MDQCRKGNQNLIRITFLAFLAINFISPLSVYSQNFRINYINADNYPVIEAGFIATNSDGIKIYNSTVNDFSITENSQARKILEVTNPQKEYQAVSIVLMIDISLSMRGRRIDLVKEGLVDFIDQIPLETSEIAIACFSDESYIYTDFTQSRSRLMSSLNRMQNIQGTNFDNAFLDPMQGALAIGQGGRNKKVIVFVTDGLGTTNTERISSLANEQNVTVFTLNIGLRIPDDLRTITQQSGGQYFERIWNQVQFKSAASAIFKQLNCTDYGVVKWLSTLDCEATKPVHLKYKNARLEFDYDVPADKVGRIEVNPSLVQFGTGKAGMMQSQNLGITSQNIPITIKSLEADTSSAFKISDSIKFPLVSKAGESHQLKVLFTAKEAGLYESNLKISLKECPDINVNLRAGGEELIKLVFPIGGETFTIGEDTSIIWEGVKKTQPVEMVYRLKETDDWTFIDKASNLNYQWKLPNDTSARVQVKLTPIKLADENMEVSAIIDANTSPVLNSFFSPDGSRIITTDKAGFVKTWNTQTGKIITSLGGYDTQKAVIAPDNERIFLLLKDETFVWNMITDKLVGSVSKMDKKVNTSFILPDGQEMQTGGNVSIDPAKNARIWSGANSFKTFLFQQPEIKWATFTPNGQFTVTLDSKNIVKVFSSDSAQLIHLFTFKETISGVIISPDGSKALVKLPQEICMLDLTTYKELYRIPKSRFQQFTATGKYFTAEETNQTLKFIDCTTGKTALSLFFAKFYEVSALSRYVIYSRQDSLVLFDFNLQKTILSLPSKPLKLATFNPDETKVYVLTFNNTLEIYDTRTGAFLGVMGGFSRKIKEVICNPAQLQIAFLMEDNRIEVWSPAQTSTMKDAVSGKFNIISPKPSVIDTIQFGEQAVNSIKELNVSRFAWNSTKYPLNIKRIEIAGKDSSVFDIVSNNFPSRLEANSQLDQEFRFTPTDTDIREAIVLTYTATDTFSTVITGKGVHQRILPLLRHLDFGKVKVGLKKDTLAAILVNIGNDTLFIRNIKNSGPDDTQFIILSNHEYRVAPNDTLKVPIRFNPALRGKTTTLLALSPLAEETRILLRGEGIAPREIILTGITRNSADSLSMEARVIKTDLGSEKNMDEVITGPDGKFLFKLLADRNFGIMAEKENFISTSINVDLTKGLIPDTIKQDIYLTEVKPGAIIRFNCIFFEFDKPSLLPGSQTDLNRLLEVIKKYNNISFEIHGHTDSKGPESYNLSLSKARATVIMNYLIKNGASKNRLSIRYFGETKPIATNSTEEGRTLNRRVELKVVK